MRKHAVRKPIITVVIVAIIAIVGVISRSSVQAQGRRPDLETLHQRLLPLFEIDGVVYTDADERTNRFTVGATNRGIETAIRARLRGLGVESQQVDVVHSEPIVQVATLQDQVFPIKGGLQIRFDNFLCTLGFNGVRAGLTGFTTASHCTTNQGGVDGTKYYQPLLQIPDQLIGTEIADPIYQAITGCPRRKVCRYSDSAFAALNSSLNTAQGYALGYIAKTDTVNTGSLTIDTITNGFRIVRPGSSKFGDTVNKVGRTTGWTQGSVTNTCVNTAVSRTKIVLLCQDFVSAKVGAGDSGSPVFAITNKYQANDVELRGILWGGDSQGTMFVYSPIENVERADELGPLTVCASGFGC